MFINSFKENAVFIKKIQICTLSLQTDIKKMFRRKMDLSYMWTKYNGLMWIYINKHLLNKNYLNVYIRYENKNRPLPNMRQNGWLNISIR